MTRAETFSRLLLTAVVLVLAPLARAEGPVLSPEMDPLVSHMSATAKPGTDFAQYASGAWLTANPIPASERGWGIANLVTEETYRQRLAICKDAAKTSGARGSNEQRIGEAAPSFGFRYFGSSGRLFSSSCK